MFAIGKNKDVRDTHGSTLVELGKEYKELVVVEADLSKASGSISFKDCYPDRFFNVGVAEQDALSFSAGLASMGKLPFVSSFACFVAQRSCDQAVNSIAYNNFNVKVIGTYAGLTSEKNGGTHISVNDIAIFRSIPRFTVIDPGDANEYAAALRFAAQYQGPVYIRSNKGLLPTFFHEGCAFIRGKSTLLNDGDDIGLISCGITTVEGMKATVELERQGVKVRHVHMSSIKPIDAEEIVQTAKRTKILLTVENHSVIGGLGAAVSEILCTEFPSKVVMLGLQDHFGETASLAYMMGKYGIDNSSIIKTVMELLNQESFRGTAVLRRYV